MARGPENPYDEGAQQADADRLPFGPQPIDQVLAMDSMQTCASLMFLVALSIGCTPTAELSSVDQAASAAPQEGTLSPLPQYVEKGVRDLTSDIAKQVARGIELVSAVCDERPTWHDGRPIYSVQIRFSKPGQYRAAFVRQNRDQPPSRRMLAFHVDAADTMRTSITIHVLDQEGARMTRVAAEQGVVLQWPGNGGPAWMGQYEWRLDRIGQVEDR